MNIKNSNKLNCFIINVQIIDWRPFDYLMHLMMSFIMKLFHSFFISFNFYLFSISFSNLSFKSTSKRIYQCKIFNFIIYFIEFWWWNFRLKILCFIKHIFKNSTFSQRYHNFVRSSFQQTLQNKNLSRLR